MENVEKRHNERQKIADKVNQMMDESYGCAESFIAAAGEHLFGDLDPVIVKISTGFSGGVGGTHEELCGGVSGAAVIIGMLYGRTTNDESLMIRCKRLISDHRDRFVQEFGTTTCQELRDAQFGADEDNPCSAMIVPAVFMLLDILEEEKEREAQAEKIAENEIDYDIPDIEEYLDDHKNDTYEELITEINREELDHQHRCWIGETLDGVGDHRPGVGLNKKGLPDICWHQIPGGTVSVEREGEFQVDSFNISRYPLTAGQFETFLNDPDGFSNPDWWQGISVSAEHLAKPGDQRFIFKNHPRDNVSWFDAVAFCRWLSSQASGDLRDETKGELPDIDLDDWVIRLPTEWEWQMAATSGRGENKFPWGQDWDDKRAHTKHNQLNKSTAVGLYPQGLTQAGVWDMSGNIWEWCLNCYDDPADLDFSRPDRRVLRGGSWYHWGSYAHTTMRSRYYPDHRYNAGGFRICFGKRIS